MSDLISRQQAINVIERMRAYIGHNMERAVGAAFIEILDDVGKDIGRLPSAQLATDTNVGTKLSTNLAQLGTDCISRQAAIDLLKQMRKDGDMVPWEGKNVFARIRELPSVQPETAKRIVGKSKDGMTLWYQCDMCNEPVDAQDNFCRGCGRRLTDG